MKRDDTKKNFTSLSGNDLQTVRLHYPSFPCIIAIVPVSRLLNLMRYSSVLNANIRFFCSENRNFNQKSIFIINIVKFNYWWFIFILYKKSNYNKKSLSLYLGIELKIQILWLSLSTYRVFLY